MNYWILSVVLFTTNFIGILVPYMVLVWIPKINGKNKAKKYDLKDPRASFEEKFQTY